MVQQIRVWRAPRPATLGAALTAETSPPLPIGKAILSSLKSWGEYALLKMFDVNDAGSSQAIFLAVVSLSDWRMWRLDARPNTVMTGGHAITDRYVYYAESAPGGAQYASSFVRLELSEIVKGQPL